MATDFQALDALATTNWYRPASVRRLAILLTDGESSFAPRILVSKLAKAGIDLVVVRFWNIDERVWQANGKAEPLYRPAPLTLPPVADLAALTTGGRVYDESELAAAASAARRYLGDGPVRRDNRRRAHDLARTLMRCSLPASRWPCSPAGSATAHAGHPEARAPEELRERIAYSMVSAWRGSSTTAETPLTKSASAAAAELIRKAIVDGRARAGIAPEGGGACPRARHQPHAGSRGAPRAPDRGSDRVDSEPGRDRSCLRGRGPRRSLPAPRAARRLRGAALAAARIAPEDVGRLRESCERFDSLRAADDVTELVHENVIFHDIDPPRGWKRAARADGPEVIQLPLVYRSYVWYSPEQKLISEHYHRQLTSALAAGDAERAELVMKEHVFEARDFLVAKLRERQESEAEEQSE